jgi:cytochrome c oxidase cbb3-type subunit IV
MYKHYFEGIDYIEVGPIIGLVVFFIFFIALIYLVVKTDTRFITKMENLPLEDGTDGELKKPNKAHI